MKLNEINDPVRDFLERNNVKNYTINSDGTVDVAGNVMLRTEQNTLPVKFRNVTRMFYCDSCQLTSLEGCPSFVGGDFDCSHNKLTSLHDVHKYVKEFNGGFYCSNNPIKNSVLGLLLVKGVKEVYLDNKAVQKILNKHLDQGRGGVISAQQELIDAGLDRYAKL